MLCSVRIPWAIPTNPKEKEKEKDKEKDSSNPPDTNNCRFEIMNPAKKYPIILQVKFIAESSLKTLFDGTSSYLGGK
jgi:hypothetical protein